MLAADNFVCLFVLNYGETTDSRKLKSHIVVLIYSRDPEDSRCLSLDINFYVYRYT